MSSILCVHFLASLLIIHLGHLYVFSEADPIIGAKVYSTKKKYNSVVVVVEKSIELQSYEHLCTGSLISKTQVLTAASCMENKELNNLRVFPGGRSTTLYRHGSFEILSKVTYKDYEEECFRNGICKFKQIDDICILKLDAREVVLKPTHISYEESFPTFGDQVSLIGWGPTRHTKAPLVAHYSELQILQRPDCNARAETFAPMYRKYTWPNKVFCAQKSPPVKVIDGDFGGPALYGNKLVGIAIRPRPLGEEAIIMDAQPVLILRLSSYKDFIEKYLDSEV
ncbi:hypothetical protein QAD02_015541 [Eretmocerus hayati]|uniref:Uncharacterized protein n=1 Tax=Eretmocerus hayati TaxID=131215 RepID=A0ACC2P8Z6_9HYME|nr:hypothetical protein QAD02_015541 [Eretmocerus hayati]